MTQSLNSSVGTVLIFQLNPVFGTEASNPAVPRYRFWYLVSGSYFSIPRFRYKVFRRLIAVVLFRYWFGSISAPNQVEPKALVLEPKLCGTSTAQNLRQQNTEVAVLSVFWVLDQHN